VERAMAAKPLPDIADLSAEAQAGERLAVPMPRLPHLPFPHELPMLEPLAGGKPAAERGAGAIGIEQEQEIEPLARHVELARHLVRHHAADTLAREQVRSFRLKAAHLGDGIPAIFSTGTSATPPSASRRARKP